MSRHEATPDTANMFKALHRQKINSCKVIMPNVYVGNWNECDALLVLKSGYIHEVEMKISISDYKADFRKCNSYMKELSQYGYTTNINMKKHDLLASGNGLPNKFSFLVPDGMVGIDDVPEYAGLYYFKRYRGQVGIITEIRSPRLLHKNKMSSDKLYHLTKKFVFRYVDSYSAPMESYSQIHGDGFEEHF